MGINSCGRSKPSYSSLFFGFLEEEKSKLHSFTVNFGAKYLTAWLLVFLPPKLSVVLKINILHQSKNYKHHFENSNL